MRRFFRRVRLIVKKVLSEPLLKPYRFIRKPVLSIKCILFPLTIPNTSYFQRASVAYRIEKISWNVRCTHQQSHTGSFISSFISIPSTKEGCIVEAGCFKGGSAAKFSVAAKLVNRELVVFDSFQGLPENEEPHDRNITGNSIKGWFKGGNYCGTLEEVKSNIEKFGEIDVCTFIKGWFEDTMPNFSNKICAAYLDVDLASSTRTCLKYLYPLVIPGGVLISQDGDFPLVIDVFSNDEFWEKEVGCQKPHIEGLGKSKIIKIVKPTKKIIPKE